MIERLYRVLLHLVPREFRERFGAEMLDTARALDSQRPRDPRRVARAVADALRMPFTLRADLREPTSRLVPARRTIPMESLMRDLRFALRGLAREPGFTAFVCITLALGIGANAAMFGIADRLLLRGPAHVRDAGSVVRLYSTAQPPGMRTFTTDGFGHVTLALLRSSARSFERLATYAINDGVMGQGDGARAIQVGYASAGFFPLLGVQPARGRFFSEAEDAPAGAIPVAVIGDGAWREWFGGSDAAVGSMVTINDQAFSVIGIAPRGFTGAELGRVDVWVPGNILAARITTDWATTWNAQWLKIVGRLQPGITRDQAGEEVTSIHRRGYGGGDATDAAARLSVAPLRTNESGSESTDVRVLRWLTGVAALVLLIACANVANLLLARGMRRGREVAIRAALGASRLRLARLLLLESVLVSLGGAALGLAVAYSVGGAARRVLFSAIEWPSSPVEPRVLVMSIVLAIATGVVIGAIPALRATRADLTTALKTGAREGGGRRSRLRTALTIAQAAVSVVLLVGAGLFVKSLWNIRSLDLGIDPERVLVVEVDRASLARIPAGPARDAERMRRRQFYLEALDRVRNLRGVEHAAVATGMPFGNRFSVKLRVPELEAVPRLSTGGPGISAVSAGYFDAIGTAIRRGRAFTAGDRTGTEPVAIVSEVMADTIWPGQDPLGKCLLIGDGTPPCTRVVGVAEDTRRSRLREAPSMHYYIPAGQEVRSDGTVLFGGAALLVRTGDPRGPLLGEIRALLTRLDSTITYVRAETVQARIDPQMRPWLLGASVFALSGLLALVVAGIGVYSVMSYLIADRRHEISVRLALGAKAGDVVRLVLRGSLIMAVAGVCIGEAIAVSLGRFAEPLLFDTSPRDPLVFAAVGGVMVVVAAAATLGPAARARRVTAVEALKEGV